VDEMDVIEAVKTRRSIRKYTEDDVDDSTIKKIIEAGIWAPSGLNNQPWKFKVLKGDEKDGIAGFTRYGGIIQDAPACIAVFLDGESGYNHTKDVQAIGACIQNMLLTIHSLGLGGVWLGEIINQRKEVEKTLEVPDSYELMAVIAFGIPSVKTTSSREDIEKFII